MIGVFVDVILDGDPFGTYVNYQQVVKTDEDPQPDHPLIVSMNKTRLPNHRLHREGTTPMATATKPNVRDLRRKAKAAKISDWENLGAADLEKALAEFESAAPAKKATKAAVVATKNSTPAKKASVKPAAKAAKGDDDEETEDTVNPFRKDTNLWYIAEALMKGGKRPALVKSLTKKIDLKPRKQAAEDFNNDAELDRRILIVGQILKKDHGFTVVREGRGYEEGTIRAYAPGEDSE